jgi:hypothetical protein
MASTSAPSTASARTVETSAGAAPQVKKMSCGRMVVWKR